MSLPYWLPAAIVRLRMQLLTRINGCEGIVIPGEQVSTEDFKRVYAHPAANGRSRGAALSDLFWYWLSPGPEFHQEHVEPGPRYDAIAQTTRHILALPKRAAEELTLRCIAEILDEVQARDLKVVRLRDWVMPMWAEFYYRLVFGTPPSAAARRLVVENANDVVTALKGCGLRHMDKRRRLTRFLVAQIASGALPHALPEFLSVEEQALYLQGVFFNTAVVQMSEATAHLLMVLAQKGQIQDAVVCRREDDHYLDRVISETLRVYPLFGIAHRITADNIVVDAHTTLPAGSVLCFNYADYHRSGYAHAERFDPQRWQQLAAREANYIPFGVTANRPCPAQGLALVTLRTAAADIVRRYALYSSAAHTRSLPNRGPCLLVPRARGCPAWRRGLELLRMRFHDRWEDVVRSLVQLVLGTYMVWDARRQRLCQRYFEAQDVAYREAGNRPPAASCPRSEQATTRSSSSL